MSRVKLIFGTCNMVPSGEAEILFEDAYQKAFKPLLTAIYNHPEILSTLYYAGPLLEWLEAHHPEFHTVLSELTSKRNIELLGGGYWEPMLPLISAPERVGQIEVMTTYLRKKFGKRPRGSWITGQVWEANLASSMNASGIDYVFLTERAFPDVADFRPEFPVITEDQGKTVVVFPVMDSLTERFLNVPPEHILESLKALESTEDKEVVVSLLLNGQTLGGNGSHQVCYSEKWLDRFFTAVSNARDWLECIHPGRYLRSARYPRKKIYIPGPTYEFLMRWSGSSRRNVGSPSNNEGQHARAYRKPQPYYREFLSKYRESELLHAKMMYVQVLTNQIRGDKYKKKNAKEDLWRGQEHYPYWHGPSGGIYSSRLRHSAYRALIEAEKSTRQRGIFKAALTAVDFDMDGDKEYLYNGLSFNAYIHTMGGALFELDYLPVSHNYLATFSKYPEDYHPPATREKGYDCYSRQAFLDHILDPDNDLDHFEKNSCKQKNQFPKKLYQLRDMVRDQPKVTLSCRGSVTGSDETLEILKTYRFRRSTLEVDYVLTNLTARTLSFIWGSEINLALSEDPAVRTIHLNSMEPDSAGDDERGREEGIDSWTLLDSDKDVIMQFHLSEPAELWRFPVFADYRVGRELRRNYQSSFFMPCWEVKIPPLDQCSYQISLRIGRFKNR